jgi:hypothetical protein
MAPLIVIAAFIIGAALGVYFGRHSLDWADLYDVWDEGAK